jgi:hypothetical protein
MCVVSSYDNGLATHYYCYHQVTSWTLLLPQSLGIDLYRRHLRRSCPSVSSSRNMAEAARQRPKPRPRARAPASASTESATGLSDVNATTQASAIPPKAPVNAVDDDDDDLFAYRRRLMRKLASQTITEPSPPPSAAAQGSGSEQEDSSGRKRKRTKKKEEADWVRSGVKLASDKAVRQGEEASDEDEVEDEDKGVDKGSTR